MNYAQFKSMYMNKVAEQEERDTVDEVAGMLGDQVKDLWSNELSANDRNVFRDMGRRISPKLKALYERNIARKPHERAVGYGTTAGLGGAVVGANVGAATGKDLKDKIKRAIKYGLISGGASAVAGAAAGYGRSLYEGMKMRSNARDARSILNDILTVIKENS